MLDIAIATRSEIGKRERNEDDLRHGSRGPLWYAVLADGAGGHRDGALASQLAVRAVAIALGAATALDGTSLARALDGANAALCAHQRGLPEHHRMHATVVALWLDMGERRALWAHAGDSRLYLVRHGRTSALTQDHSVVQQMVDAGLIGPAEARRHPRRNQLLMALGSDERIDAHVRAAPFDLRDGDAFLLCSDGWWDTLEDEDIERSLEGAVSAEDWLDRMAALVRQRQTRHQDNYSAVAVWIGDPTQSTRVGPL
jgi:PPM family protein phosphatase